MSEMGKPHMTAEAARGWALQTKISPCFAEKNAEHLADNKVNVCEQRALLTVMANCVLCFVSKCAVGRPREEVTVYLATVVSHNLGCPVGKKASRKCS